MKILDYHTGQLTIVHLPTNATPTHAFLTPAGAMVEADTTTALGGHRQGAFEASG